MSLGPLLLPTLVLAAVLIFSAVAKLRHRQPAQDAFVSLRLPRWLSDSPIPRYLPLVELALAAGLLLLPPPASVVVAAIVMLLMLAYLLVVARALTFDEPVTCNCFGDLGLGLVTRATVWRNLILVVLAQFAVYSAMTGAIPPRLAAAPPVTWLWLALTIAVATVAVLIFGTPGKVAREIAYYEEGAEEEELDYLRQAIPFGVLQDADGEDVTLQRLVVQRATLLVFVSLGCGGCQRIIPQIEGWVTDLEPVSVRPVLYGEPDKYAEGSHNLPTDLVLYDPEGRVGQTFQVGTPSAVLLGADGMLAGGPVIGEEAVSTFVADIREQLNATLGPEETQAADQVTDPVS